MRLRIENVGPLREAEVDLSRRLIVLTGPNNTGKTYLAWSVYGLHRSAPRPGSALFDQLAETLLTSSRYDIDLGELLTHRYQDLLSAVATDFAGNIHHCFAAERGRFEGAGVELRGTRSEDVARTKLERPTGRWIESFARLDGVVAALHQKAGSTRLTLGLSTSKKLRRMFEELTDTGNSEALVEETRSRLAAMTPDERGRVQARLSDEIAGLLHMACFRACVIFPAERLAVNIFARELALKRTELVDELVDADIEGQRQVPMDVIRRSTGRYPWPIRDSLRIANDLAQLRKEESRFADIAAEIETAVLGGTIEVSGEGEMSFAPSDAPDRHLGVHLTASVVKSLSSLVFYFRHLASSGDFLIIDEPELNLHPDNQRRLARILARAVNRGFRLMISTHSDYVVRELNHMIMLSKLSPEEARTLGYDPGCTLAPEDIGVYLFENHTATALPVTETGFSVPTIDEQINSLNADAQRLYARIFGDETA